MNRPPQRTERGRGEPGDDGTPKGPRLGRPDAPSPPDPVTGGLAREHPGAEGPVRIAPARGPSQGDSGILPRSIASQSSRNPEPSPPRIARVRLTPRNGPSYHPPDERAERST